MSEAVKIPLDFVYEWEQKAPDKVYMTQPLGGDKVQNYTWKETMQEARKMATYLKSLDYPEKSHIAIFSKNCAHWIMADIAIWMAGHVSIPVYPTLTADSIKQILEHSESKLCFVGKLDGFEAMEPGLLEDMKKIALPLAPSSADYPGWDEVLKDVEPMTESPTRDPEECGTIVYTSGSTGVPKGAMLNFKSMIIASEGLRKVLKTRSDDRMLSYLPLSHVFERWVVEMGSFVAGFHIYFAESLQTFVQDLQRAEPTLFVSVPRLWNKFQLGVSAKMPEKKLKFLLSLPIINKVIKKKVLSKLGLQSVRFAGTGSAPIPAKLIDWYRGLGLELLEGYGMTENLCYSHVSMPGQSRVGYVGNTYPGVECKISDDGEILVKSPGSMMGYYKMPEKTEEAFTEDGYFKTGDAGEIDSQGRLKITGRVKEQFKTAKGKYVAPAPIENRILTNPFVEMACVSGSGFPQPYGLVMLSEDVRERLKKGEDVKNEVVESLTSHLSEINSAIDHHEKLQFLKVVKEEWDISNGFLTPTMKIKRAKVESTYNPFLEEWYEEKQRVLWQ